MAASDVQIQIIGRDMASPAFRSVHGSAQALTGSMANLGNATSTVNRMLSNSVSVAAGIAGYQGLAASIESTLGSAFQFTKSLETTGTGMAGILMSMTQINGRTLTWGESLSIAKNIVADLSDEALRTAASSEELTRAFQAILGPGLQAKMSIEEIQKLTVTGVNAVKSLGLPAQQVVQELRDLVQGGIQPASSTLATALGLKDSDIKAAKESSEGLFKFLMDRLKGFETASGEYAKTWQGINEQIREGIARGGAEGLEPLFAAAKEQAADLAGYITQVNQETGKVQINPDVVAGFRTVADATLFIANHAKEAAAAFIAWKSLSAIVLAMRDISAVTAGANVAQTFLGKSALQVRTELEAQAIAGKLAGATIETASVAAAMGQHKLAQAILAVNNAHAAAGVAATSAGTAAVTAASVAKNAAGTLLSTVWALAGGWVGVAVATGYAINKLLEYKERQAQEGYWEADPDDPSGQKIRYIKNATSGMGDLRSAEGRLPDTQLAALRDQEITNKFPGGDKSAEAKRKAEEFKKLNLEMADAVLASTLNEFDYKFVKLGEEYERRKALGHSVILLDQWRAVELGKINEAERKKAVAEAERAVKEIEEKERKRLADKASITDKIKKLTLSEKDYSIWQLNQEKAAFEQLYADKSDMLNQFAQYYKLQMTELSKDPIVDTAAKRLSQTMEDSFVNVLAGAQSLRDGLKSIWQSMIEDIARTMIKMTYQQAVINPIANWWSGTLNNWFGAKGTSLPSFDVGKRAIELGMIPARAYGGAVEMGRLYRVNEPWGPYGGGIELFQPSVNGTIIPANSPNMHSMPNVQINITNNSGQEMRTTSQQVRFDNETQTLMIDLLVDGVARNINGSRDNLAASLGVA